jgi:membrane fusion protein (multidrug efflux system)
MAMPPAEVTVEAVGLVAIPVTFEYPGQALGSKEVEVRARVTGILEQRLFQEGARVKAGQTLFRLDPRPFEAQAAAAEAELLRAQAQRAQAERELARLKPLAEKRAVGQKEADDAQSNVDFGAAAVKAAQARLSEARLNLGYTRVVAPLTGVTSRAIKSEGSLVSATGDSLLTSILQIDPIWVQFSVPDNDRLRQARAVAEGKLALPRDNAFAVTLRLADGSLLARTGQINFADSRVNAATGSFETRAEFPNADSKLVPGQFVRVTLAGATRRNAIAVPQRAVQDGPQGKFVYVLGKDKDGRDIAAPKPVVVGDWVLAAADNRWIIESGLAAGDRVIIDGMARIFMPGAPVRVAAPDGAKGPPAGTAPAPAPAKP